MRTLAILFILFSIPALAQQHIAQFVVWQPKAGAGKQFETGYKKHLEWHKANRDPWGWHGWFIISGPRSGQFVDATVDHEWSDFDHPLKPAEDRADNDLHVYPHAELQTVIKAACLKDLSVTDNNSLRAKFLRMITLQVTDMNAGIQVVEQLKHSWPPASPLKHFLVYKPVDGGDIHQLILMLGFNSFEELGKSERLQEMLASAETALKVRTITAITSETLVYREDMSLFPE